MTKLSVNVNKVATLRNTRTIGIPGVVHVSRLAIEAGAHGITVHPRPDQRHIRPHDVYDLGDLLRSYPSIEFNIEGNPFHEYMHFARDTRPVQCTLVPDSPEAFTSNHGWDLLADGEKLRPILDTLHGYGCRVSLFLDPVPEQIERAVKLGADRIELYTEPYATAHREGNWKAVLDTFSHAAQLAHDAGLGVNAGHDLSRENLPPFLAAIPFVDEVSIGHALIADALEFGMSRTVALYLDAMKV